jgi:hypothetical protein
MVQLRDAMGNSVDKYKTIQKFCPSKCRNFLAQSVPAVMAAERKFWEATVLRPGFSQQVSSTGFFGLTRFDERD